jgi:hypothetical protein
MSLRIGVLDRVMQVRGSKDMRRIDVVRPKDYTASTGTM